jgi:hypothetical protein
VSLAEKLDGKTVVTADHGEMLGARSSPVPVTEYAHPARNYVPELVKVPWLVFEGDRRTVTAEEPLDYREKQDIHASSEKRLKALGYVE